jgi:hypothetical protein
LGGVGRTFGFSVKPVKISDRIGWPASLLPDDPPHLDLCIDIQSFGRRGMRTREVLKYGSDDM